MSNYPLPYHTPILNELARIIDLSVIYMGRSKRRIGQSGGADEPWTAFDDQWGTQPQFEHEFHWSLPVNFAPLDFATQWSVGVSARLQRLSPDVVLFSSWGPLSVEPLAWKARVGRAAVMWSESTLQSGLLRGPVSQAIRRIMLAQVDAFISNGTEATKFVRSMGVDSSKIVTSRLPSRTSYSVSAGVGGAGTRFLYAGRLIARKRPLEALAAFEQVHRELPNTTFNVVGDGPLTRDVQAAASRIGNSVTLLGRREGDDLAAVFAASDVLVMPAVREVWGLVVNEAIANGLFVLATNEVASAVDLLNLTNGSVIRPDVASLAHAMRESTNVDQGLAARTARRSSVLHVTYSAFALAINEAATIGVTRQDLRRTALVTDRQPTQWTPFAPPSPVEDARARDDVVRRALGPDAQLISVSSYVADSRVYRRGSVAMKLRSLMGALPPRMSSLREEAELLRFLGRKGIYELDGRWELLLTDWLDGAPLDRLLPEMSLRQKVSVVIAVGKRVHELHKLGIAHGDIRPDNVVLSNGAAVLIDFNRASKARRFTRARVDWFGFGRSLGTPFWQFALCATIPRSRTIARRVRSFVSRSQSLPSGDATLAKLERAWDLARESASNAPGQGVAYYALSVRDRHFAGERPFELRWELVRNRLDFTGIRVLELGCNMGLFSTYALAYGAASAVGIDHDRQVIASARLVAEVFRVQPVFIEADLETASSWEAYAEGVDVVFCMSLVHWLRGGPAMLRLLSKQRYVVYEGHDSLETESARLRAAGFRDPEVLGVTERGRHILLLRGSRSAD